jgi:glycosyltransferase involved in cell wall biosynthesis
MADISVIMTGYNRKEFISEAIESVQKQSYSNSELIVIEDGSIESLNIAMKNASGKYIAFIDAIDIMHIDRLKIQRAIMEEEPTITVCGTWYIPFGGEEVQKLGNGLISFPVIQLLEGNFLSYSTVMIRKDFLCRHNLQFNDYPYAEDYKLWFEIAKQKGLFYIESQPLLYYRISDKRKNISKQKEQQETNWCIQLEILSYLLEQNKKNYPELFDLYQNINLLHNRDLISKENIIKFFYTLFIRNRNKLLF